MYSFYGGQKGQDFKISKIFSNREQDLFADLQARWYSPVGVGEYVFISYGDISKSNSYNNNIIQGESSNYNTNLNIDIEGCGRSYNNSIWQKVYIDNNRQISPVFPENENNVYIYVNIENDEENHIHSTLKESSDIFSDSVFGFGYRLIACVTGQTPNIEVYNEVINLEDGEPYVTVDTTILERPKIKFYQNRGQRIENVKTNVIDSKSAPYARIITNENVNINNHIVKATLTEPVLELNLPKTAQNYSGVLFGKSPLFFDYGNFNKRITLKEIKSLFQMTSIILNTLKDENVYNSNTEIINNRQFLNKVQFLIKEELEGNIYFNNYYFKTNSQESPYGLGFLAWLDENKNLIEENQIPWGFYGFNKQEYIEDFKKNIINYINYKFNLLETIYYLIINNINNTGTQINFDNSIQAVKNYLLNSDGKKIGFLSYEDFNKLNLEYQRIYLIDYYCGLERDYNLYFILKIISNLIPNYNFNFLSLNLNIEFFYNKNILLKQTDYDYIVNCLEEVVNDRYNHFIINHFQNLLLLSQGGDSYFNTTSNLFYKIIQKKIIYGSETELSDDSFIELDLITNISPKSPSVQTNILSPYTQNGDQIDLNKLTISTNYFQDEDLNQESIYTINIPQMPNFAVQSRVNKNIEEVSLISNPSDENTYSFNFEFPSTGKFYSGSIVDQMKITPSSKDIFINVVDKDNLGDIYQGSLEGIWKKTGNLQGPPGAPKIVNTYSLYETEDGEGDIQRYEENNLFSYKIKADYKKVTSIENIMYDILKFNSSEDYFNLVPDSNKGEIYLINYYTKKSEEEENYEQTQSWWGSFYPIQNNIIVDKRESIDEQIKNLYTSIEIKNTWESPESGIINLLYSKEEININKNFIVVGIKEDNTREIIGNDMYEYLEDNSSIKLLNNIGKDYKQINVTYYCYTLIMPDKDIIYTFIENVDNETKLVFYKWQENENFYQETSLKDSYSYKWICSLLVNNSDNSADIESKLKNEKFEDENNETSYVYSVYYINNLEEELKSKFLWKDYRGN